MSSKAPIRTSDNSLCEVRDMAQFGDILNIAGLTVSQLQAEHRENILVIPGSFDQCKDRIGDEVVCDIKGKNHIQTNNVVGFIGINETRLKIGSRFDSETTKDEDKDYFLQYMLEKVLQLNLVSLNFTFDNESIFDLLIYFFPVYLKQAMSQGIYREYQTFKHNDSSLKGTIDFSRHISSNFPFTGRIAYSTREYSHDNNVTELIRHTIEYINSQERCRSILNCDKEMRDCVSQIVEATPSYSKGKRSTVLAKSLRPTIHPYYSEYYALQKLCAMILRKEEIRYGNGDDKVFGLLIDCSWLWEAFLYSFLKPMGFEHPDNVAGTGGKRLFENSSLLRYPDFYIPGTFVLDAKYKRMDGKSISGYGRDDLHQIITYMDMLGMLDKGGFIFPAKEPIEVPAFDSIRNRGGTIYGIPVHIPQESDSYEGFRRQIEMNIEVSKSVLSTILNGHQVSIVSV